jgi:hypothetical protein
MYENMTAAELWEAVKDLHTGFKWPCVYGLGDDRWHLAGGTPYAPIPVPEAAAMLERACKDWLNEHNPIWHVTNAPLGQRRVHWRASESHAYIYHDGQTELHALVKAVEAVHASEAKPAPAPVEKGEEVTPTRQPDVARHSFTIAGKEQSITLAHEEGKPNAWVSVKDKVRDVTVDVYLFSNGLVKLRKAIDAAIDRIGGVQ